VTRAISSELLKLRTTRTFLALVASAALLVAGVTALAAAIDPFRDIQVAPGEDLVGVAWFAIVFALVLGLLVVTTEFRHGTIAPTLLAVPSRGQLIAAKLVAHVLAGFALGLAAVVANLVLAEAILSLRGIESGTSLGDAATWAAGLSGASALLAGLGVGFGAIVRNQVGALVGAFAWLFVVEPLLAAVPGIGDAFSRFGIFAALDAVDGLTADSGDDLLAQGPAALLLVGYVVLLAAAGAQLLRRRDVT
jgi:ABC-2 type transport system permease protein